MKSIAWSCILFSVVTLFRCKKDSPAVSNSLLGQWVKSNDPAQFIIFKDSQKAIINNTEFTYTVTSDSVYFHYNGESFVYCPPTAHKIAVDLPHHILLIDNLNKLCLQAGDAGTTRFKKKN